MKATTTLKSTIVLFLIIVFTSNAKAQDSLTNWELNSKSVFTLNNTKLTAKTTYKSILATIGQANSEKTYPSGEVWYQYDSLGFSIATVDGKIRQIGFNFNWDGDKKYPEKSFDGTLKIGDYILTARTTDKDLLKIDGVVFICPIPIICATPNKKAKIKSMAAFEEGLITQILIILE